MQGSGLQLSQPTGGLARASRQECLQTLRVSHLQCSTNTSGMRPAPQKLRLTPPAPLDHRHLLVFSRLGGQSTGDARHEIVERLATADSLSLAELFQVLKGWGVSR